MTYCTCWADYPNKAHKKSNGQWLCVDKYKCVRHRTGTYSGSGLKTKYMKISEGKPNESKGLM